MDLIGKKRRGERDQVTSGDSSCREEVEGGRSSSALVGGRRAISVRRDDVKLLC